MKIDIFSHILPLTYKQALDNRARTGEYVKMDAIPALFDLDSRFRIMDKFEGLSQVLTLASPPVESVASPGDAVALCRLANDGMAELVMKHPDRFVAAVACLPMNNIDAALMETDRAIGRLNFKGVQIYTSVNGKPLDSPEFIALYEKMAEYDLPVWIHPCRDRNTPDYSTEEYSRYRLYLLFGWPYETTIAASRLVFSGVLERYPNIKFITHHCGGMIPYFEQRIRNVGGWDQAEVGEGLTKSPVEYFRMLHADTALSGSTPGLMCGYTFFGADRLLFGTDMPYGGENGERHVRQTISSIERMGIAHADKEKIFAGNAKRLLHI